MLPPVKDKKASKLTEQENEIQNLIKKNLIFDKKSQHQEIKKIYGAAKQQAIGANGPVKPNDDIPGLNAEKKVSDLVPLDKSRSKPSSVQATRAAALPESERRAEKDELLKSYFNNKKNLKKS